MLPAGGLRDLLDRGALGALEHLDHQPLLGAGAGRGLLGRRSFARLAHLRLGFALGRRGRTVGSGRRRALVGRARARLRVVLGLDADGLKPGACDSDRWWVVASWGALGSDQALGLEAAENLVDGAALDL
jgi:hypothetical protein